MKHNKRPKDNKIINQIITNQFNPTSITTQFRMTHAQLADWLGKKKNKKILREYMFLAEVQNHITLARFKNQALVALL